MSPATGAAPGAPSLSTPDGSARLGAAFDAGEITRAARVLWVRSRREATSLLVGGYASAFRGGGVEFEESRPYAPGDDIRFIDWNATARTGEPWVKRFREERSQTVLLAIDTSASMGFGSAGRTKLETAAAAAALIAAAAGRVGDSLGLVAFSDRIEAEVRPGRSDAHTWRIVRAAAETRSRGGTNLALAADWLHRHAPHRAIVVLLSDFRDCDTRLATLGARHDCVACVVEDPRERQLLAAGPLRLTDSEHPARRAWFGTGRRRRALYGMAAEVRRRALERRLRADGAEPMFLSTDADPLQALGRFFDRRDSRRRRLSR